MKTNPRARRIIKARFTAICLTIAVLAVIELGVGESLISRIGQTTAVQTELPQGPSVTISDLMAGVR